MNKNPIVERDLEAYGTFVREIIKPGAQKNMDATKVRTFRIVEMPARIHIPADVILETKSVPDFGDVPFVNVNGVEVHFHGGISPKAGEMIEGKVTIYVKTWERCGPNGEELNRGYRNYTFFVDVEPSIESAVKELKIYDTASKAYDRAKFGRKHNDIVMDFGMFCHESADKRRDLHLAFVDVGENSSDEFSSPLLLDPLGRRGGLHIAEPAGGCRDVEVVDTEGNVHRFRRAHPVH